ncbi:MAG TPA: hypothetical protein VI299_26610 [Polyangiales bacterium]
MRAMQGWTCAIVTALLSACNTADAPKADSTRNSSEAASDDDTEDGDETEASDDEESSDSDSTSSGRKDAGAKKPSKKDAAAADDKPVRDAGPAKDDTKTADAGTKPAPTNGGSLVGLDFFKRIAGTWTGINSNTPIGFDFPMTVDFAANGDNLLFGMYKLDDSNNVLWGFNIETYNGKDVLAYRNGGYLLGLLRDSRTQLVEYDEAKGYYRFCATLEHGLPVNGCSYIEAKYTFTGKDKMLFEVTTRSGKPHVHWEATRMKTNPLPATFPATTASQGNGSAPWPDEAGLNKK